MNLRTKIEGFVLICILFNISTSAGVDVGLDFKGGFNFSNIRGEDIDEAKKGGADIEMLFGANGGIGMGIGFRKYFIIQPEIFFAMKGFVSELGEAEVLGIMSRELKTSLNYLEIPILFKINIPAGTVIPNFYIGPYLGILLNAQTEGKMQFSNEMKERLGIEDVNATSDVTDRFEPVDFGLSMGSGIGIKAGPGRFIVDIRYTLGFLNIREQNNYTLTSEGLLEGEMKNGSLSLILGYGIDFSN